MKNLLLLVCLFLAYSGFSQIRTPAASPSVKVMQTVGLTDVTVEYSAPGVKDRAIFGDLVPYGEWWRTGANAPTSIEFGDDVTVNGSALKKGKYVILTKPGMEEWTVNFYTHEGGSWSGYREKEAALSVMAPVTKMACKAETFTIAFQGLKNDGATMGIFWDDTWAALEIGVPTDEKVEADIARVLGEPSQGDYYNAASYYHSAGKDLKKALEWITIATAGDSPRFWQVRRKALIQADLGMKKEAIATAKQSLELAKAAGNADYVRMNEKSIKEWSGM